VALVAVFSGITTLVVTQFLRCVLTSLLYHGLNCADIIFSRVDPHFEIQGSGFRSSDSHCEFRCENDLNQLGFNCAAITMLIRDLSVC